MINCAENCMYEEDGLCTLKEVRKPSATPLRDCPYFEDRAREMKIKIK